MGYYLIFSQKTQTVDGEVEEKDFSESSPTSVRILFMRNPDQSVECTPPKNPENLFIWMMLLN